ncbi:precorrin-6A/cobalt-precorrin-6A reductase [Moritella viscosa]|uniref:Precorrin-6x reductase, putative n=1 Tax=Moritella viscosa TaxID=80854 RepID=A0ABY1HB81_9GAMM|nr:precorrin-6A/cobalt-precorrin-6A reductase [Moritella viscosa]CED61543.1 precorrin-6x reductase [Moritella viscosa]SGY89493.1 Precorrin-6x reductase, putative [Moritella viscosa]SGY93289.1 Precorrin-6x reductase, putative [Moritella viscosa]SGY93604.1 Precorrin-6x reductase, putative [Moritella viscosa]SGY97673.1 Precorrin-6x reductase, putative [Moritella viscosa]
MKLLLLGGTADGRKLAIQLHASHIPLIYSVAGLVRVPNVGCEIVSGGFSQFGGLQHYIREQNITAILDVTHPYAQKMSSTAAQIAKDCDIPYWRFHRLQWENDYDDNWLSFTTWPQLLTLLQEQVSFASEQACQLRPFFTVGQLEPQLLTLLSDSSLASLPQLVRTAVEPKATLLPAMQWIKAIGPFAVDDEITLFEHYGINALITKNSGGDSTIAKLTAARILGIPVFMQTRPSLPPADVEFISRDECHAFVCQQFLTD